MCAGLRNALRLDDGELRKLVLRLPVPSLSVDDNIAPSLQALQALLGVDEAELGKLVRRTPSLIAYDSTRVEDKLAALAELFNGTDTAVAMARRSRRCSLTTQRASSKSSAPRRAAPVDARKLLASTPRLLALDPRGSVAPKLEALQNLLPGVDVLKLVVKAPQLLEYDVDGTPAPRCSRSASSLATAMMRHRRRPTLRASSPPSCSPTGAARGGGGLAALKQVSVGGRRAARWGCCASLDLAVVKKRISLLTELLPRRTLRRCCQAARLAAARKLAGAAPPLPKGRYVEAARGRAGEPRLLLSGWGVLGRLICARARRRGASEAVGAHHGAEGQV